MSSKFVFAIYLNVEGHESLLEGTYRVDLFIGIMIYGCLLIEHVLELGAHPSALFLAFSLVDVVHPINQIFCFPVRG